MSVMPKMTLIGMYNYDDTLFEQIDLPAGIDKDLFVDSLLLEKGELPVLYASLDFNKNAFGVWSRKWYHSIERMFVAFTEEYNPLHNFDRNEDYSDSESRTMTNSATGDTTETGKDTETGKITDSANTSGKTEFNSDRSTETNSYEGNEANTENTVSAYNSDMYQPDTNSKETGSRNSDSTTDEDLNSTETTTGNSSGTTNSDRTLNTSRTGKETRSGSENEKRDLTHKAHLYGNIGVTKSQEMLIDELNLRANHNIYDAIIEIFANEFLISVY